MKKLLKRAAGLLGYEIHRVSPPSPRALVTRSITVFESELLKEFADRTAQLSSAEANAIRHLYLTGILGSEPRPADDRIALGGPHTRAVGIWRREREGKDSAFLRIPNSRADSFLWASKDRIEPKRTRWRVALLGESVARGYLYDPQFNVASVLERILHSELGPAQIDVVDLAKSNMTIEQLRSLIGQSLALEPDVIVIFAGNNWRPHITESDIPYVHTLLRRGGVPAMKSFLDNRTEESVRLLMRQVNDVLAQQPQLSVIWVIPEFNLKDWKDPPAPAPHLAGRDNERWRTLDEQARRAFREKDIDLAARLSLEMTKLDGGTSSVPLRLLAECSKSANGAETYRYLQMCRDAEGWDPSFQHSPRVSAKTQEALREASSGPRIKVVDLPRTFERQLDGGLPDRRIFLDYCHLTAEGIDVAMAEVASAVVGILTDRPVPPQSLRGKAPSPTSKVEGKASFLAAVHNAHFYQSFDVVHHWCARALTFWPECAEVMTRYIDSQTRCVPLWASKSTLELFDTDEVGAARYLLWGAQRRLDLVLGDAIVKALDDKGRDIRRDLTDLRREEHSPRSGAKELIDFYYGAAVPSRADRGWTTVGLPHNRGSHAIFASALWETSTFIFAGQKERAIGLKVSFRIPRPSPPQGLLHISVNGYPVGEVIAERTWQTLELCILGKCVADGMNEIEIAWPTEEDGEQEMLDQIADALIARQLPRFHRVFGEISSLLIFDPAGVQRRGEVRTSP